MVKQIDFYDYISQLHRALRKGVLVTTGYTETVNCMTISWGQIGVEWNRPVFTIFIRTGRFTHELLGKNPEFTVNFPLAEEDISKYTAFCGTKTGRSIDKPAQAGLELVKSPHVSVPGVKQLPLTLECKVIYRQLQEKNAVADSLKKDFYPEDVSSDFCGSNRDYHEMFMGEIVGAYIAE